MRVAVISNLLVALSFVVYAFATLSQHQGRTIPFPVEESGPIEVVLSHRIYGTSAGVYDNGLWKYYLDSTQLPADQFIGQALRDPPQRWGSVSPLVSGTGVGSIVLVQAAFFLFGVRADALPMLQVLVIGISVLCFAVRYQGRRLIAAPILLSALTFLLATTLSAEHWAVQAPIGGVRYYIVAALLPALHWCLDMLGADPSPRLRSWLRWIALTVQILILGVAILVRGSPIYLLIPVALSAAIAWLGGVRETSRHRLLIHLAVPAAVLMLGLAVFPRFAFPAYATTGRLNTVFWHRAFIGLGVNPHFPFPGMREKYDCTAWIPERLIPGTGDRNGHCVWTSDPASAAYLKGDSTYGIYGRAYEVSLRRAFFNVLLTYPREAFATFFYYKPIETIQGMKLALSIDPNLSRRLVWLSVLQLCLFVGFVCLRPVSQPVRRMGSELSLLLAFAGAALGPQILAWTNPSTAIDMTIYVFCAAAIVLEGLLAGMVLGVTRRDRAVASST
jgi:hypothetical protein